MEESSNPQDLPQVPGVDCSPDMQAVGVTTVGRALWQGHMPTWSEACCNKCEMINEKSSTASLLGVHTEFTSNNVNNQLVMDTWLCKSFQERLRKAEGLTSISCTINIREDHLLRQGE